MDGHNLVHRSKTTHKCGFTQMLFYTKTAIFKYEHSLWLEEFGRLEVHLLNAVKL